MVFKARDKYFDLEKKPVIMGILNITPDSFSDGGEYYGIDAAVLRCGEMIRAGADIIDIGGESSRPGSQKISAEEELERVMPVLTRIRENSGVCISIDTYKPEVAEAVLSAGADMINCIFGTGDIGLLQGVVSSHSAAICLMHIKGVPENMQDSTFYDDIVNNVYDQLKVSYDNALRSGIDRNSIAVDPGIGFGKSVEGNLKLLKNIGRFTRLGCPVLVGTSRKSFIGSITGNASGDRLPGTLASNAAAFIGGARMFRVHDIKENLESLEVVRRIVMQD
jgi:dihydropteroate synthase